jgi:hypothetical protein
MDVVAGRKTVGEVRGEIFVNGRPKDQRSWSRTVGYVEQSDVHSPGATVAEALWFSARLRLPPAVSDAQVGLGRGGWGGCGRGGCSRGWGRAVAWRRLRPSPDPGTSPRCAQTLPTSRHPAAP